MSAAPALVRRLVGAAALLVVVATLTVLAVHRHDDGANAEAAGADPSIPGTVVQIGPNTCGLGWSGGAAGHRRFAFWNTFGPGAEAYLVANPTGKILLDAEGVGLNATRSFAVDLAPGTYHFACVNAESGVPARGPDEKVTGSYDGPVTAGVDVLSSNQLLPAIQVYGAWVGGRLPVLHRMLLRLRADLVAGEVAKAKSDWLTAHLEYETLGAAYGAFGEYDARINPLPARGIDPATDPGLVGFPKVEALLWSGAPARASVPVATKLAAAVQGLSGAFQDGRDLKPVEMGLRAHEILENAVQVELTGRDDAGSHTELATIDANIAGTRQALDAIRTLVVQRLDLSDVDTWLSRSQTLVESYRHGGTWTPFTAMSRSQREQLDATLSQTVEQLSQVAVVTDPRQAMQ